MSTSDNSTPSNQTIGHAETTRALFASLVNRNVKVTATIFLHLYQTQPKEALAIIRMLLNSDQRALTLLVRQLSAANPVETGGILVAVMRSNWAGLVGCITKGSHLWYVFFSHYLLH